LLPILVGEACAIWADEPASIIALREGWTFELPIVSPVPANA